MLLNLRPTHHPTPPQPPQTALQASAQPFLVFGLLTTGLAVGAHNNAIAAAASGAAELADRASSLL